MVFDIQSWHYIKDSTKELVEPGVKAVNTARPVNQMLSAQINPLRAFGENRAEIDYDTLVVNEKHYFTCIKIKQMYL